MKNFREKLKGDGIQIGCCITYPAPGAVERIGPDWDWIWIDAQHGELGYSDVLELVRACDLIGAASFVRVPDHRTGSITRALDMGATGVIVPQISSADEARSAVKAAKFPPLGRRSYGGRRVVDLRGRGYSDTANADTMLMVQIESPEALANAAAIAAVEGVDILLAGPDDISLTEGMSMTRPKPADKVREWQSTVAAACRKYGKVPAAIGMGSEMLALFASLGFRMIACGSDVSFLAKGSREASAEARDVTGGKREGGGSAEPVTLY